MLNETLPKWLQDALHQYIGDSKKPDMAVRSDLSEAGTFGERWLIQVDHRILIYEQNHGEGDLKQEISLTKVTDAKAESLVGNGILELIVDGHPVEALRFSNAEIAKFHQVARMIEVAIQKEGAQPPLDTDDHRKRCKNCNRILPEWSDVCPACVNKGKVLRRLLGYMTPYWRRVALVAALMFIGTGLDLVPPALTRVLIDDVLTKPHVAVQSVSGNQVSVANKPVTPKSQRSILPQINNIFNPSQRNKAFLLGLLVLALVAARILRTATGMWQGVISSWIGDRLTMDIRTKLYQQLQYLPLSYYDKRQTGAVMARVTQDTNALQGFLVDGAQYFLVNILLLIGIGSVLFAFNWKLALLVLIPAPLVIAMTLFFWRRILRILHRYWHSWSRLGAALGDSLSGMRVVKAFAQEPREVNRFSQKSNDLFEASFAVDKIWSIFFPVLTLVTTLGSFLVWYVGGLQVLRTEITLGVLMAFLGYMGMFYGPLQVITRVSDWLSRCLTAAERIFEIMDTEQEIPEDPESVPMEDIKGNVSLENIRFGYDKNKVIIDGVNMDIKAGEMIGLVGRSGAGKTTLINLICRFYDVNEGRICVDGVDVRKIRLRDLRTQIGAVLQEPFLFNGTIADNIAYAKPGATREEIMIAARAANAHEFIMKFPDGYDTQVGERGQGLSGGERQRISIARAILHNPRILILDEATSSVDTETEKQIQEALTRLVQGRTTFAIAHRLSTLRNSDKLLVLEDGKVKEFGTHDELLQEKGVYCKLVEMQTELSKIRAT